MDNAQQLKALAEAATPIDTELYGDRYFQGPYSTADLTKQQDAYIAAMSPDVALQLLEERAMLLEVMKEFIDAAEGVIMQGGRITIDSTSDGWFDRARAAIAKCTGEK